MVIMSEKKKHARNASRACLCVCPEALEALLVKSLLTPKIPVTIPPLHHLKHLQFDLIDRILLIIMQ